MSLSHSDSESGDEVDSIPVENVEFSVSLNDEIERQRRHDPVHIRQQSAGSSIGSEDPLEPAPMTQAAMQQYWQQWQQYYAAYGFYPQQQQQQQQQSPQQYYPETGQYPAPQSGQYSEQGQQQNNFPLANYPPYMYPAQSSQMRFPQQDQHQQQTRAAQQIVNQTSPYTSWSTSYAQNTPPPTPSEPPNVNPLQHKRSSSNPGISSGYRIARINQDGGGSEVYTSLLPENKAPKGALNYGAVSTGRSPKLARGRAASLEPTNPEPRRHQRSNSDSIYQGRIAKGTGGIPPTLPSRPMDPLRSSRKRLDTSSSRPNSIGRHRRESSFASSGGYSVSSMVSVVSDIRKSAFYSTATETKTGRVQLHFPFEAVHLVPKERNPGILYKVAVDDEVFENYHRIAEESTFSWLDSHEESFMGGGGGGEGDLEHSGTAILEKQPNNQKSCRCLCQSCVMCDQKIGQGLPPNYFMLTVPDTLYRNILDEICAANRMPCGIFFCGHHEDVSRPSIWIAVVVVMSLFGAMAYAAFVMQT